jgi:endonuclease YncB( thermonuclease family)
MRHALPLALLLLTSSALAAQLDCRVVAISDGDTLTCLTAEKRQEKIRLRGIDAPERKQPWGEHSRQHLAALAHGKPVVIDWQKRDRWKRIIGTVWVEPADCPGCGPTLDAGRAQLAAGMAWWFKRYASDQPLQERHSYEFEEAEARARRVGLWADPQQPPPWEWRAAKH